LALRRPFVGRFRVYRGAPRYGIGWASGDGLAAVADELICCGAAMMTVLFGSAFFDEPCHRHLEVSSLPTA